MNRWKLFSKALAATIAVFIVTTATILIMWKCPAWLCVTIGFLVVFGLFYNAMRYNNEQYDEEDEK